MKLKRPLQCYPIVEVWWDDATNLSMGWKDKKEFDKDAGKMEMVLSVGFLVHESKDHIVVAMDLDREGQHNQRGQIPRAMIKRIKVLKAADPAPETILPSTYSDRSSEPSNHS